MSGIVGSINTRGSGIINLGSAADGQIFTGTGAGLPVGFEAAAGGDTLLQKKWYYFNEGSNLSSSNAWADAIHPVGDGTLTITPAATGNIIQIDWNWYCGHAPHWHSGSIRISYASGGSYATAYGLGNDCGWGTMSIGYSGGQGQDSLSGTAWVAAADTNAHTFKFQHNGGGGGAPGIHLNERETDAMSGSPEAYSNVSISEYDATSSAITAGGAL